jgi:DnaD/phage-associated family protein
MAGQSFVVYAELEQQIERLTDAQAGALFRGMFLYNRGVEPVFSDPTVALCFDFVRPVMDKNREKWEEVKEKRAKAGKISGEVRKAKAAARAEQERTKRTSVNSVEQERTKRTVNVNGNVNVNVNANENKAAGAAVVSFFKRYISNSISPETERELIAYCQSSGEEVVTEAIETAAAANKKSWGYIKGILNNWQRCGKKQPIPGLNPTRPPTAQEQQADAWELEESQRQMRKLMGEYD